MNARQREAMLCTEGPELILAGAGSGKTRVLTHRIAYLIEEKRVEPWHIMAITFTNKAAQEMRSRVDQLVSQGAEQIWVSTFHSSCVRILRRFIDRIGYDNHFTIYDADDQKTLMKQVFKELNIDTRSFKERSVLAAISSAKDELKTPEEFAGEAAGYAEQRIAECYRHYQEKLWKNNALDFDDLIFKTVQLFQSAEEVLEYYQDRFRYIMVDEYQDTNTAQFRLIELLAKKHRNLCVVGDDDQSIYKFRGANIYNILNFEEAFPGAKVVKLEQNYRSGGNILQAANEVIKNNQGRKQKRLWTERGDGDLVQIRRFESAQDEAEAVAAEIRSRAADRRFSRFAVLYRTNAQSRLLEERFVALGLPYQLVGGVNFYQRREIKDVLAYLKTIANGRDDLAVRRILNVPKRGIGAATAEKIAVFAAANALSFYDALRKAPSAGIAGRAGEKLKSFVQLIEALREKSRQLPLGDLIQAVLADSGYAEALKEEGEIEAEARRENIDELINKAVSYEEEHADSAAEQNSDAAEIAVSGAEDRAAELPLLDRFLEEVALVADIDSLEDDSEKVTLMTLHAAKGLEFDEVYMTGMEDGLFPGNRSIDDPKELEEERRLCYVGITRAKERLTLCSARTRMINGETHWSNESMFLREIPDWLKESEDRSRPSKQSSYSFGGSSGAWDGRGLPWDSGYQTSYGGGFGSDSAGESRSRAFSFAGEKGTVSDRKKPPKPVAFGKEFQVVKAERLDYGVGDRVQHIRFGEGVVRKIEDGSRDFEVTVEFDAHGTKKMFAGFAKLQKL